MEVKVIIKSASEERTGLSVKTGKPWSLRDIEVEWNEIDDSGKPHVQQTVATVHKKLNEQKLISAVQNMTKLSAILSFGVREFKEKKFASNSIYLPNEFYEERED